MKRESTIQLDVPLLLPSVVEGDPCIERLQSILKGREGVARAHVTQDAATPQLCIHFDPDALSVSQVEALAKAVGVELDERYEHMDLEVEGLLNERRARVVTERLTATPDVLYARASASAARVHIELAVGGSRERVLALLAKLRVRPRDQAHSAHGHGQARGHGHGHGHGHGGVFGPNTELVFSLIGGAMTLAGWVAESWLGTPWGLARGLLGAGYFFGGFYALREMIVALRTRRLEIDFLMLVAAIGAAALGEWVEGGLLLFLFSLGHALEGYAMGRARRAIEALADLAPKTATVIRADGTTEEVRVERLEVGIRVLVRPSTRLPADGFVVEGESAVDQAPITGESIPVDKRPVDDLDAALRDPKRIGGESIVFAGTVNGTSALQIVVTKAAQDSTLARVVTMVREAQTQRSPTQRFTDRFERVFVPSILLLVVLSLFAWVVIDEPFSASFYRAMALLVAASPCALAIATPSAVLSGVARAARGGVLIKGGVHLESLGSATVVAFDKTGTLTKGEPRLTDIIVAEGATRAALAASTLAVESQSDHPLAKAMTRAFEAELESAPRASDMVAITGHGVQAVVDGVETFLGKPALFSEHLSRELPIDVARGAEELAEMGRTVVVVATASQFLGVLGLMDTPRDEAKATLVELRRLGVRRMLMLTGDHQRAADAIAKLVGLDEARGNLLPEDKVAAVHELASQGAVAMVGDGVNDAPAMAQATVGVAMGASGSDVALETADVALMGDDLSSLPFAVGLSRASRRIIRQNLWASLGMVAFLIPATLSGFTGIGWAVLLHEGSTLVVVANALRLLAYRARG